MQQECGVFLIGELERRFGCGLEELARRFDHSVSWVSRRLALVELLPETRGDEVPGADGARQRGGLPADGGGAEEPASRAVPPR